MTYRFSYTPGELKNSRYEHLDENNEKIRFRIVSVWSRGIGEVVRVDLMNEESNNAKALSLDKFKALIEEEVIKKI